MGDILRIVSAQQCAREGARGGSDRRAMDMRGGGWVDGRAGGGSQIVGSMDMRGGGWVCGRGGGSQIAGSWTCAVVHGSMDVDGRGGVGGRETEPQTAVNKAPSVREHACLEGGESVGQQHQAAGAILQEHRIVFRVAGITKTHRPTLIIKRRRRRRE